MIPTDAKLSDMVDVSVSKWGKFLDCPAAFAHDHKQRAERLPTPYRSVPAEVGNLVHATIQIAKADRVRTGLDASSNVDEQRLAVQSALAYRVTFDELQFAFDKALKMPEGKGWVEDPDRARSTDDRYFACDPEVTKAAFEILEKAPALLDWSRMLARPGDNGAWTIGSEVPFTLALGEVAPGVFGNAIGVIDRIDVLSWEPRLVLRGVDYKTGNNLLDIEEAELDPQACLYMAALKRLFPKAVDIQFELHYLGRGKKTGPVRWSPELDRWALMSARNVLWRIRNMKGFPETPGWHCGDCARQDACAGFKAYRDEKLLPGRSGRFRDVLLEFTQNADREKVLEKRQKTLRQRVRDECKVDGTPMIVEGFKAYLDIQSNHKKINYEALLYLLFEAKIDPIKMGELVKVDPKACAEFAEKLTGEQKAVFERGLERISEKNSFVKVTVKPLPDAFTAAQGAQPPTR